VKKVIAKSDKLSQQLQNTGQEFNVAELRPVTTAILNWPKRLTSDSTALVFGFGPKGKLS
jgi:hypothetical protein